ncbi:MAG: hypothetical protein ACRD2N_19855 [Vicinamibacterales bacterium]
MRPTTSLRFVAFLVVVLASAACASVTINKVLADPARYRDREVTISGQVSDSFSVASRGAYRLRDGSGELWVVSEKGVPRTGAEVKVTGTVREGYNIGFLGARLPAGLGSGVLLVESSHRAR